MPDWLARCKRKENPEAGEGYEWRVNGIWVELYECEEPQEEESAPEPEVYISVPDDE